jgi:pyruvate dehydrogenase E2 component (dihydrolipoamide acetyltransferase)
MPSLGADMEAGSLVEWLVKPGDRVARGDVIAVVDTQKGAIEVEVFEAGIVDEILVPLRAKVPVGTVLARIRGTSEVPAVQPQPTPGRVPASPGAATQTVLEPRGKPEPLGGVRPQGGAPARSDPSRVLASPAARRYAREHQVELAGLKGSGPDGALLLRDVDQAGSGAHRAKVGLDLDAMRGAIAAAMARSKKEIPHYYLAHSFDVSECQTWLSETNQATPPESRLLLGVLLIRAVALAAREFPAFNGFYRDGRFEPASSIHVGVAIAIRGGGLAAPALHDADRLPLSELMARLRDLVQRTRTGRLRSSELSDATITVSSLGDRGVETLYGIIYPPQVALVGFGKVVERPWVVNETLERRPILTTTLAADHRVSDGHVGALFLNEIEKHMSQPEAL